VLKTFFPIRLMFEINTFCINWVLCTEKILIRLCYSIFYAKDKRKMQLLIEGGLTSLCIMCQSDVLWYHVCVCCFAHCMTSVPLLLRISQSSVSFSYLGMLLRLSDGNSIALLCYLSVVDRNTARCVDERLLSLSSDV